MTIYDRIKSGEFGSKVPRPEKPGVPTLLNKRAGELTNEEMKLIDAARAVLYTAMQSYKIAHLAYHDGRSEALGRFWVAVEEHFGIIMADPFMSKMCSLAWERGHSGGYSDVVSALEDLMPLYELYVQAKGGAS